MAGEKQTIVIKKVYQTAGGGHGGGWKVAFADFMTAMMCFFLVMWLLNQSDEVKKEVADYFTGPSILEQNFNTYGAELTLEKLFTDLINDPLEAIQSIMRPADLTPNLLTIGTTKIKEHHVKKELGDYVDKLKITSDEIIFEVEDKYLFEKGSAEPANSYLDVMKRVSALTMGLENSNIYIESLIYASSVLGESNVSAKNVANKRLDLIKNGVDSSLENESVDIFGHSSISNRPPRTKGDVGGFIRFQIRVKEKSEKETVENSEQPDVDREPSSKKPKMSVYDDFLQRVIDKKKKRKE